MCTRFSFSYKIRVTAMWERIKDPKNLLPLLMPRYNIAPTDETLVIINESGQPSYDQMIFGMIPHWAKDAKMGLNCLNARSETITEKPSFREPLKKRRCLVPADGFYEWKKGGKKKIPHRVVLKNREPFLFAGLWDEWKSPAGKNFRSFAIITTEANSGLSPLHDRMPVILKEKGQSLWLDEKISDPGLLCPVLQPYPSEELEYFEVSTRMSNSSYKEPDSIEPVQNLI